MHESPFTKKKTSSTLNEAQKRSLSVSLQLLEEELFTIQLLAANGRYIGQLFSLDVDLNGDRRQNLQKMINRVLSHIHDLKERLDLEVKTKKLSRRLMGTGSYFWSVLCDQKSDKLRRYGAVSKGLSGMLDPALDQILEALQKMVEVIEEDGG